MKKNNNDSEAALLRKKALELLKKRPSKSSLKLSEVDTLMLIHELDVHQVELEIMNEELTLAKSILHEAVEKYSELYDFAPSGYFTLSSTSEIIELNFRGSQMLGQERAMLLNSQLGFFVSYDTKLIFNQFLEAIFNNKTTEACEVTLVINDTPPIYVHINGIVAENEAECHVTIVDITERRKVDMAIKQSEERYLSLINNLEAGVVVHAPDTSIIKSNPKASELLGLSEDQMKGKLAIDPNWKFFDENNVIIPIENYPVNLIISTKKPIKNLSVAVNRPVTNDFAWLTVNGFPAFNNNGEIAEIVISFIDITERKKAEAEIINKADQLRQIHANLQSIREEERTNIAREIHDELGQELTGLKMDLHWLSDKIKNEDENVINKMKQSIELINTTILSVRKIATDLRPSILDDLGLIAALEWHSEEFEKRSGTTVKFINNAGEIIAKPEVATAIFRIYQELLTNIARHANASLVIASLFNDDKTLWFSIKDNGIGFNAASIGNKKTLGLLGIKERALLMGGSFELRTQLGEGAEIIISIPLYLTQKAG